MPAISPALCNVATSAKAARVAAVLAAGLLLVGAGRAEAWSLDDVAQLARQNASTPYQPAATPVPVELTQLGYDAYRDIHYSPDKNLWRTAGTPTAAFEANFFHAGQSGEAVRIHEISAEGVRTIAYKATDFNFGKNRLSPESWPADLAFAGFRAYSHLNTSAHKDELIAFLGASYFRALGTGQRYGLSARGLAVDTTGAGREEFPRFTDFWLDRPLPDAQRLTIYALMNSERVTGAYRFDITPGNSTTVLVDARLFFRSVEIRGTAGPISTLGLAPLSSMFFFGENQPRAGDFRPEVHDSDGLMVASGDGEWLWRPLQNPASPLVTAFALKSLKGFGLMQRDRSFDRYEDTEARYDLRPSAWVTPMGDWGAGRVELLQFNTPDETHDNVAAYWVPEKLPLPGESLSLSYQIAWQGKDQQYPPNGWVTQSRRGVGYTREGAEALRQQIHFVLDFTGPALQALPEAAAVRAVATAGSNGRVLESIAYKNPANGAWRVSLRVQRFDAAQPVELRAFLLHDNQTLSETWTTLITP